ncbi:hypothetical protein FE257_012677 [Aspergillus nanangensis]|uniref:Xylanolytic transcriptional activator regulatory domain-containing protein n=1 Tax=Aspergillus nanangensis TaxID=2582783 RepID=A0AAD4CFS9_ASPNN|nr:hypothetical protein FE257_012677 [Aspergillus nanangensis]
MSSEDQDKHLPSLAPGPRGPCTGRPSPCKACQNNESECIFDETLDLRRKVAARRTHGEMEYYRSLLYSLVESLRSADEARIQHILDTIRDSSSLNPIAIAIDAPALDVGDATFESLKEKKIEEEASPPQERLSVDSQSRITLEKLCDNPLFRVPATPWTIITDDDHLVSHLISLYFTWDHPLQQVVDQKTFLSHMAIEDTDTDFCSPLLVNSILAVASESYSDFPEVFAVPGDAASRGQHFYAEAERLWKAEEGRVSLTNIQAVCLMSYVLNLHGKGRASWMMLKQAVQLAQDWGMFQSPRARHHEWDKMPTEMQYVGATTAWGIFMLNSQMSMEFRSVPTTPLPRFNPFTEAKLHDDIMWAPYPISNSIEYCQKPALLRYVMAAMTSLTEIVIEIEDLVFDKAFYINIDGLWMAARSLYSRLEKWLELLPDVLKRDDEQMPQTLFLHVRFHHTIISLFDFPLSHESANSESHPSPYRQGRLTQLRSARHIAHYLRLHRESYGLRQISGLMLEPTNISALILVTALDHDETKNAFVEVCRSLVAFSKRLPEVKDMIRNVESTARLSGINLPPDAVAVLGHKELKSSQWL